MQFLSFLKGMKIEDHYPEDVTFRTSRTCSVLGVGFLLAGCSMAWQACAGHTLLCFFGLVRIGSLGAALLLCVIGAMISSYRKNVVISRDRLRIEVEESSLLTSQHAAYHFQDVLQIEVCPMAECILTAKACLWTIKAYVRRGEGLEAVRLFHGRNVNETLEAASLLSQLVGCSVVKDVAVLRALSFTREVGTL
ncbi:MAG TPA: hypothetical protein PLP29_11490 [Candidatus Ozemobacteraceae bacterium]|nr:hypothetical protein [Candidatus Ozemobacteraceae bacterium]